MFSVLVIRLRSTALLLFSSRRRHTRCLSDWSSDVCSSDLGGVIRALLAEGRVWIAATVRGMDNPAFCKQGSDHPSAKAFPLDKSPRQVAMLDPRSEERRVGKEGRSRWSPYP